MGVSATASGDAVLAGICSLAATVSGVVEVSASECLKLDMSSVSAELPPPVEVMAVMLKMCPSSRSELMGIAPKRDE